MHRYAVCRFSAAIQPPLHKESQVVEFKQGPSVLISMGVARDVYLFDAGMMFLGGPRVTLTANTSLNALQSLRCDKNSRLRDRVRAI